MSVRLVDGGWEQELHDGLQLSQGVWRFACPFIKQSVVERLLATASLGSLDVVTRFSLGDFARGVSDIDALRDLVEAGGEVRGLKDLHAKVFVFGGQRAVVTSANLTNKALSCNAEFGCVSDDAAFVDACDAYVKELAGRASAPVTVDQLDAWQEIVASRLAQGAQPADLLDLPDFGAAGPLPAPPMPHVPAATGDSGWPAESLTAFVKFFGKGDDRASPSATVLGEVEASGCHWACTYPKNSGRPRQVADGDTMFMARMTHSPADILIFGRAIGLRHVDERDTASAADIAVRPWKTYWPHYIRVHHAEFVAGTLSNGVSLNELMQELGANALQSTKDNIADGGNTDPRRSLMRKAAVRLTSEGFAWLTERFEHALATHGRLPADDLEQLDWPAPVV